MEHALASSRLEIRLIEVAHAHGMGQPGLKKYCPIVLCCNIRVTISKNRSFVDLEPSVSDKNA